MKTGVSILKSFFKPRMRFAFTTTCIAGCVMYILLVSHWADPPLAAAPIAEAIRSRLRFERAATASAKLTVLEDWVHFVNNSKNLDRAMAMFPEYPVRVADGTRYVRLRLGPSPFDVKYIWVNNEEAGVSEIDPKIYAEAVGISGQ